MGARRPRAPDRERAGRRCRRCAPAGRRPRCGGAGYSAPARRSRSTRARSKRTKGSICCSPPWRSWRESHPDAARARRRRRPAEQSRRRGARPQRRAVPMHHLHRQRPARRFPPSRRGRRAGVAAHPRHQHAAEDLPVPPIRQADRRDPPAHAHAGAFAGSGPPRGAGSRAARGGGGGSARPSGRARATGDSRCGARGPEIQPRGLRAADRGRVCAVD